MPADGLTKALDAIKFSLFRSLINMPSLIDTRIKK